MINMDDIDQLNADQQAFEDSLEDFWNSPCPEEWEEYSE